MTDFNFQTLTEHSVGFRHLPFTASKDFKSQNLTTTQGPNPRHHTCRQPLATGDAQQPVSVLGCTSSFSTATGQHRKGGREVRRAGKMKDRAKIEALQSQ
eukprot:3742768-Karenia_brevis.AAC.1